MHLRNDTGRPITVSAFTWNEIPSGLKRHPSRWSIVQAEKGKDWSPEEDQSLTVKPHGKFRVKSVCAYNSVGRVWLIKAKGNAGKVSMAVAIEKHQVTWEKQV